jgi:hypothetical protein
MDPDVALAAHQALDIINETLDKLSPAETFDYGGHLMHLGEYDVCEICTRPIAEAQQAQFALQHRAEKLDDPEIREHVELAADIRAELHNGLGSEAIVDRLNGFRHDRGIRDDYGHSHHGGNV